MRKRQFGARVRQRPAGEVRLDLLAQPGGVDHQPREAARLQRLHGPLHQRFAAHRQQGFGRGVGQWAHARAESGGQHHGATRRVFSGVAHLDLQCRHVGAIPGGERREIRVSQRSLQIVPDTRHVPQILRLVVAAFEPREYAEDF